MPMDVQAQPNSLLQLLLPCSLFLQVDVNWVQNFRSSDGVKREGSSSGAMHSTNEGLKDGK